MQLKSYGNTNNIPIYIFQTFSSVKTEKYNDDFASQEGLEPSRQRWFFGGKLLGDKLHVEEAKVSPGYVIQVIVNPEPVSRVDS
ncbi:Ubiquitin domain-containing protein 2 [Homalodisca vitripennis]|nr:Ubiquitin domain-containing protein 2 [Homalodisca vitripennis]